MSFGNTHLKNFYPRPYTWGTFYYNNATGDNVWAVAQAISTGEKLCQMLM